MTVKLKLIAAAAALVTACANDPVRDVTPADGTDETFSPARSELQDTAWRLVEIRPADGAAMTPQDRSAYTLVLGIDGTALLEIDCNRGNGKWSSGGPGRIEFGPIATTRALCPPGSLHDSFLAAIERVTDYAIVDERLLLTAGSEGDIMEFEHAAQPPVAATVLGSEIRTDDAGEMQAAILKALFERYEAEHGISVTDAEVDAFVARIDRVKQADLAERRTRLTEIDRRLQSGDIDTSERESLGAERDRIAEFLSNMNDEQPLSAEEAAQVAGIRRSFAREMILHWKLNRALYEQYGGRIAGQQLGPEPLDAYREFLEEQSAEGAFVILRPEFEREFWRYFTDDSLHSFQESQSNAEGGPFDSPPWSR